MILVHILGISWKRSKILFILPIESTIGTSLNDIWFIIESAACWHLSTFFSLSTSSKGVDNKDAQSWFCRKTFFLLQIHTKCSLATLSSRAHILRKDNNVMDLVRVIQFLKEGENIYLPGAFFVREIESKNTTLSRLISLSRCSKQA